MIKAVICDDEMATHKIIRYLISSQEIPVEIVGEAYNGAEAVTLIKRMRPDLAFLDIQMPGLNGFEVMEKLDSSHTKIIIITVYSTFAYAQRALRMGVSDILEKPLDIEALRAAISRAMGWNFTPSETLNSMLRYIHEHYAEKIELADLADAACCTATHASHLFRKYMDATALDYINKVRIGKAQELLRSGESIQNAAFSVGYSSLNHFYKKFKEIVGETPAAYQNRDGKQK